MLGGDFGGGGGGTTPGIGGGGGGGASYVFIPRAFDHLFVHGQGTKPGGLTHDPPEACGIGYVRYSCDFLYMHEFTDKFNREWDKTGGLVGQGGIGNAEVTKPGNNGGVRIFKPGHY